MRTGQRTAPWSFSREGEFPGRSRSPFTGAGASGGRQRQFLLLDRPEWCGGPVRRHGDTEPPSSKVGPSAARSTLAAYALGCGATGLTFLDDDVTDFFSPDAAGKAVMFLIAVGRPARRTGKSE